MRGHRSVVGQLFVMSTLAGLLPTGSIATARQNPSTSIEGVVLNSVTGQPVSGATITRRLPGKRPETYSGLNGPTVRNTEDEFAVRALSIQVQTDAEGRFSLDGLDTGRIEVAFGKDGYVVKTPASGRCKVVSMEWNL